MDDNMLLRKYYDALYTVLKGEGVLKKNDNSILLRYLKLNNNPAHRYLIKSSVKNNLIPAIRFERLLSSGVIRESTIDPGRSYITAHGVWKIEEKSVLEEGSRLIDEIDKERFYYPLTKKEINDKDRVKLFTMIATRTFSEDLGVSLKSADLKEKWKKVTDKCCDYLLVNKYIISSLDQIYGKPKSELPIVNLFRHSEDLGEKTKYIFSTSKIGLTYYLAVADEKDLKPDKLVEVVKAIFGDTLKVSDITRIIAFWSQISFDSNNLFEIRQIYAHPDYDTPLETALYKIALG